jgi:hypothetical protein
MKRSLGVLSQWLLMTAASAFLFIQFFRLNAWLFSWLEHAQGINWVFLPAGFRVLLVLGMGLPGAVGIFCGNLWLDAENTDAQDWLSVLLIAAASGFGPWAVKFWMESRQLLDRHLHHITASRLLHFVLVYAVVNAVLHQIIRWSFDLSNSKPWLDVWPMFVGDVMGALAILYTVKFSLTWLRQRANKRT